MFRGAVELLQLCVHRARPWSTARGRCHHDDGVGVEWHVSRRMCNVAAVHDHVVLHDVRHRWHADAAPHGHHQVGRL